MNPLFIWIGMAAGAAVSMGVLVFYGASLGSISNDPTDWGSFGAVLSGSFTLLAATATIGTLLLLIGQQKAQIELNSEQLKSTRFQQYHAHRSVFFERLRSVENAHHNNMAFWNPEGLYQKIFYQNTPTNCEYVLPFIDDRPGSLADIRNGISMLFECLASPPTPELARSIPEDILSIQDRLHIRNSSAPYDGDIIFRPNVDITINTGINIYSIAESIHQIIAAYNSIAQYGGVKVFGDRPSNEGIWKDSFIETFVGINPPKYPLYALKEVPGLFRIEELYLLTRDTRKANKDFLFEMSFRMLEQVFTSRHTVAELTKNERAKDVIDFCHKDFLKIAQEMPESEAVKRGIQLIEAVIREQSSS
jgi:hypothetical protein